MMRLIIGLLFIVVPVVELALLIKIGQSIGALMTVALVLTMAFTGILIISQQSFTVLRRSLEAMSEGRPPVTPVLDGLFLMAAGALLLIPGLITDAVALILLVPPFRRAIARWSVARVLEGAPFGVDDDLEPSSRRPDDWGGRRPSDQEGPIIEGEFERVEETSKTPRHRNGDARPPNGAAHS